MSRLITVLSHEPCDNFLGAARSGLGTTPSAFCSLLWWDRGYLAVNRPRWDFAGNEGNWLGQLELEQEEGVLGLLEEPPDPEARLVEALRARVLVQAPEGARSAQIATVCVDCDGALPRLIRSQTRRP